MVQRSFRFRLFLVLTLLTAVIAVVLTSSLIIFERNSNEHQLRQEGKLLASFLVKELQFPLYAESSEDVAKHVSQIFGYKNVAAIRVRNSSGRIIADISRNPAPSVNQLFTITEIITTDNSSLSPEAQLLGEGAANNEMIGNLELTLSRYSTTEELQHFIRVMIVIGLTFWILVSTVCYLILKRMTGTVDLLLGGIREIEAGDLSKRITVKADDETGRAANAINQLAEALQNKSDENIRLQAELVNSLRLEINEEKTKNMAKLIQTNRMTSLGLLVSSMAHEINNPNGIIRLACEYLEKSWQDALPLLEETYESEGDFSLGGMPFSTAQDEIFLAIDSISRGSKKIERVVHNLRSYSLGDREEKRSDIDLNRVTNSALTIIRAHGRQTEVNIVTDFSQDLPLICGNSFQLEQVVTNLLLNAIQSLPQTGSRRVAITTSWGRHDNEVALSIRDEGHGILPEQIPLLCEPFFSTRINAGGSGLGLYISNFIVKEHKGLLEFSSKIGMGTTVTVHLPIKLNEEANGLTL